MSVFSEAEREEFKRVYLIAPHLLSEEDREKRTAFLRRATYDDIVAVSPPSAPSSNIIGEVIKLEDGRYGLDSGSAHYAKDEYHWYNQKTGREGYVIPDKFKDLAEKLLGETTWAVVENGRLGEPHGPILSLEDSIAKREQEILAPDPDGKFLQAENQASQKLDLFWAHVKQCASCKTWGDRFKNMGDLEPAISKCPEGLNLWHAYKAAWSIWSQNSSCLGCLEAWRHGFSGHFGICEISKRCTYHCGGDDSHNEAHERARLERNKRKHCYCAWCYIDKVAQREKDLKKKQKKAKKK